MTVATLTLLAFISMIYVGLVGQSFASEIERAKVVDKDRVRVSAIKVGLGALVGGICLDVIADLFGMFTILNMGFVLGAFFFMVLLKKNKYPNAK